MSDVMWTLLYLLMGSVLGSLIMAVIGFAAGCISWIIRARLKKRKEDNHDGRKDQMPPQ